jgi:hypothetical protein
MVRRQVREFHIFDVEKNELYIYRLASDSALLDGVMMWER